ncbi:MAG: hypothetical protein CMJ29_12285 [Phycisphaerae bacterium]|nr:hypothetical protein [Phycisphaerae bacterium]MAT82407.1 hypothetical protein [Phycisphaerae bacterium]
MKLHMAMSLMILAMVNLHSRAESQMIEIEDTQAVQLWWSGGFQCANNYWYTNPPMMQGGWCSLNTGDYTYSGKKISMWRFDLSDIPEEAVITALKVRLLGDDLYGQQGNTFRLGMKRGTGVFTIQDGNDLYGSGELFEQPGQLEAMEYDLATSDIIEAQGDTDWLVMSMSFGEYWGSMAYLEPTAVLLVEYDLETCAGDFNQNDIVDVDDLLALINVYGSLNTEYDLDGNALINVNDVLILLSAYGECE